LQKCKQRSISIIIAFGMLCHVPARCRSGVRDVVSSAPSSLSREEYNNVQPGPVDTDMNPAEGEFAESLKRLMALPRYGHVDEIAAMVAYLAGLEAGYVTGANLMIDGGFSA
jgi:hypothetical protein